VKCYDACIFHTDPIGPQEIKLLAMSMSRALNRRHWWEECYAVDCGSEVAVELAGDPRRTTLVWRTRLKMPWWLRVRLYKMGYAL
jgi:hypothetical protein